MIPQLPINECDSDTILRYKAATLKAEHNYTGCVAVSVNRLRELYADDCWQIVRLSLIAIQYESRFGK